MEHFEYIDDWYCANCCHGPLTEEDDNCPECNTKHGETYPAAIMPEQP